MMTNSESARRAAMFLDLGLPGPELPESLLYYQGYALPQEHDRHCVDADELAPAPDFPAAA